MNTNATNHTSDNAPRSNSEPSAFQKAMSDVFSLNAKVEGASIKLLSAMWDMEATFDAAFCERYTKTSGKDRSEMLDKTLNDLVPAYEELVATSKINLGEFANPSERHRQADRKQDAQKKLKTAQNTLRNVFSALLFLRMGPPQNDPKNANVQVYKTPCTKIEAKNGKLRYQSNGTWDVFYSIGDLVKFGTNTAAELGWNAKKASSPRAGNGTSAQKTAEKAKATGGHFQGAIRELSIALQGVIANVNYDKMEDSDLEALRNLETALIRKVYADDKGYFDLDALTTVYGDKNTKRKNNEALAKNHAKGVAAMNKADEAKKVA